MVFPGFCTLTPLQLGQIGYDIGDVQAVGTELDKPGFALDVSWSPNPLDEISVSAELYIASSIRDKTEGRFEPSLETLNYKGDAVRIVMETLRTHGNHVPQSVVMAVSLLAVGCVSDVICSLGWC